MADKTKDKKSSFTSFLILLMPIFILITYLLTLYRVVLGSQFNALLYFSNAYAFIIGILMFKVISSIQKTHDLSVKHVLKGNDMISKLAFGFFVLSFIVLISLPFLNVALYISSM